MTLDQFCAKLARKTKRTGFGWRFVGVSVRGGGAYHCPLSFVARTSACSGIRTPKGKPVLGLSERQLKTVVWTVDGYTEKPLYSKSLRQKLLKACGLKEAR